MNCGKQLGFGGKFILTIVMIIVNKTEVEF